ncbi:hypothetical protein [Piscinibacter sp.]|uniref:hypothetical protein n=1 Tax=Piscinibacter sp. TaxID=1903157 RepID=UPI0035598BA2
MATPLIPVKTPDGQAELSSRQRKVSQRHRTVLLLVDGRRSEPQVRALAAQAGVPDAIFDELLALGLILLPEPTVVMNVVAPGSDGVAHVDIPLVAVAAGVDDAAEPPLPPSRTLQPDSVLTDSVLADAPVSDSVLQEFGLDPAESGDPSLEEARGILMRAVRAEAPLAGRLTMLRLKRARSRDDLASLLDEVESRIIKPYRSLAAQQTLRRVRQLLGADSALPAE